MGDIAPLMGVCGGNRCSMSRNLMERPVPSS